jgi:Lysylphosphatidylglycerol synthase TM region
MRKLLLAVAGLAVLGVGAYLTRHSLGQAVDAIETADPNWLFLAGLAFIGATAAAAGSWCCAVGLAGGDTTLVDSCARYGCGSLVNTFVPARAGDALRIALFSKLVRHDKRVRSTVGSFAAIGAARAVVLIALVVAGAAAGAMPLWPLAVLTVLVVLAVAAGAYAHRHDVGHFLDAFRALFENRRAAIALLAWMTAATLARYLAAASICAALPIKGAFAAAIIILPALDLAMLFPVTPGNVGLTSGAIAVALKTHGISFHAGLAAGLAFHGVETAVGLLFGVAAVVWFAPAIKAGARLPSPS